MPSTSRWPEIANSSPTRKRCSGGLPAPSWRIAAAARPQAAQLVVVLGRLQRDVVAEPLRLLVRVGVAADVDEQRGVVDDARAPRSSSPSRSARRSAIRHWRSTCSIGWPKPRSTPSESAATSSASRTCARSVSPPPAHTTPPRSAGGPGHGRAAVAWQRRRGKRRPSPPARSSATALSASAADGAGCAAMDVLDERRPGPPADVRDQAPGRPPAWRGASPPPCAPMPGSCSSRTAASAATPTALFQGPPRRPLVVRGQRLRRARPAPHRARRGVVNEPVRAPRRAGRDGMPAAAGMTLPNDASIALHRADGLRARWHVRGHRLQAAARLARRPLVQGRWPPSATRPPSRPEPRGALRPAPPRSRPPRPSRAARPPPGRARSPCGACGRRAAPATRSAAWLSPGRAGRSSRAVSRPRSTRPPAPKVFVTSPLG